ncbi:hypothetical protein N7540_006861 [Penicillium herquei]|nr:hypothetical protein N7540_006861 [Penicillium herquei]
MVTVTSTHNIQAEITWACFKAYLTQFWNFSKIFGARISAGREWRACGLFAGLFCERGVVPTSADNAALAFALKAIITSGEI